MCLLILYMNKSNATTILVEFATQIFCEEKLKFSKMKGIEWSTSSLLRC